MLTMLSTLAPIAGPIFGTAIILALLAGVYMMIRADARSSVEAAKAKEEADLVKRQSTAMNKKVTRDEVEDDLRNGRF